MSKKSFDSALANELVIRYQQGDEEAFNELFDIMQYPIRCTIGPYKQRHANIYDELYQEACYALVKAAQGFDATKGYMFITYANKVIKGELFHYFRDKVETIRIPSDTRRLNTKINHFTAQFLNEHNRKPTVDEIYEALKDEEYDAKKRKVNKELIKKAMKLMTATSIDGAKNSQGEDDGDFYEKLGTSENVEARVEARMILNELYEKLTPRERHVLIEYYLNGREQRDIAKDMNTSQMTISRIATLIRRKARDITYGKANLVVDPKAVERLTDRQRQIYELRYIKGSTYKEIMAEMSIARNTCQELLRQLEDKILVGEL